MEGTRNVFSQQESRMSYLARISQIEEPFYQYTATSAHVTHSDNDDGHLVRTNEADRLDSDWGDLFDGGEIGQEQFESFERPRETFEVAEQSSPNFEDANWGDLTDDYQEPFTEEEPQNTLAKQVHDVLSLSTDELLKIADRIAQQGPNEVTEVRPTEERKRPASKKPAQRRPLKSKRPSEKIDLSRLKPTLKYLRDNARNGTGIELAHVKDDKGAVYKFTEPERLAKEWGSRRRRTKSGQYKQTNKNTWNHFARNIRNNYKSGLVGPDSKQYHFYIANRLVS